jgi:hypothetical protein
MTSLWVQPDELGDYANTEFASEAAQTASYLMWAMSGRKFSGVTTVTERYTCVLRRGRIGNSTRTTDALLFNGSVYNIPRTDFDFDEYSSLTVDGISPESRIKLRGGPVTQIHSIRNRLGEVLDPSYYYLVDHSTVQISVGAPWTPCNTEITYSYGSEPPTSGKMAARTLAIEFAKLWNDDETCALPQRVTSVSRQGVSYTILDSQDFIDDLRTGLYAVDLFLKTANPDKARAKAKVFSVDAPRARRYTPKPPVYTPNVATDIIVKAGETKIGEVTLDLDDISATFLVSQVGWTPSLTIKSYSGMNSKDLGAVSADVDTLASTINLNVGYNDANTVLGRVDPGSWSLYATHTNNSVVLITSGNLKISTTL